MALENDELPKASDKTADKVLAAGAVSKAVIDEKPPKQIKEKTNLEELDEGELETLLKETLTYKSPRDRDCRSSLFNKLLVSAEDSIRKDSALNASGSEAVRHRNPQATSRCARYQQQRGGTSTFSAAHQVGKHGAGGVGGSERKGGRNCCAGTGGGSGGGSIADKGTLGGSLNNLTVEDLYESISHHLQQRPEKSVSARQRTGGSLPCNVNAGLITPCETPLNDSELISPPISANIQQNCSSAVTTLTTTTSISPTVTTSTYCLTASSCGTSNGYICALSGNNNSADAACAAVLTADAAHVSAQVSCCVGGGGGDSSATIGTVRDCCVIEVEQEEDCSGGDTTSAGDMLGIKQPQRTPQTKPPLPSTVPNPNTFTSTTTNNNNTTTNFLSSSNTNCSSNNTATAAILSPPSASNTLLCGGAFNIPHIDDEDAADDYIVVEDDQHRRCQRQLNYTAKQSDGGTLASSADCYGTELQPMGSGRRAQHALGAAERVTAAPSTADYYFLTFREAHERKQTDRDDVDRRPLVLNVEGDGRVVATAGGGGPMKIIGQGPQIKPSQTDSLHKQLLNSSIQNNTAPVTPTQNPSPPPPPQPSSSPPASNKRPSTNDINLNDIIKSSTLKTPSPISQQQQPAHQHTGAVRISSLSTSNMLNLNHRRLQQQSVDDGGPNDMTDEVVIGVPSTLTGTMGGEGASRAVGSFLSERTIHVGDVIETPASSRQSEQEAPTTHDVTKSCGILPNKKAEDNGNHGKISRKKVKPPEAVVRAEQVEGHRGDIAFDINKLVAFINGNEDSASAGNVAKSTKTTKSNVKLQQQQQQQQQHRGSVSGTGNNNRAGGKSVDAEHHAHSRRHQNHHHNQQSHQQNTHGNTATTTTNNYQHQLHRANSLEEMPTTTLEQFHANESSTKSGKLYNNNTAKQTNKVSQQQTADVPNKKSCVNGVSGGENGAVGAGGVVTSNRGRDVLRQTKSNAEKSGGSRSGGSAQRGGVNEGGSLLQPRRSWTNADPSPLQAIQHGATTASAENLETDFTLVNSKKKKSKKQQHRRNSVGSRTPINTPQTITSPPTNNRNNNNNNNNNQRHHTNSTADSHAPSGDQQRSNTTVNNSTSAAQSEDCSSSDGDNAAHLSIDGASGNGASTAAPFVGTVQTTTQSSTNSSLPNLTSYASITKSNVATQQPTVHIPPQPQTANMNTVKWPMTTTTTTITATMLTTASNNNSSNNNTTTTTTVVHPETVVVAVQVKVVTNRSQEQQTDDIVPTNSSMAAEVDSEKTQMNVGQPTPETDITKHQICTDPPSLNDMQRWPSINNKSPLQQHTIDPPPPPFEQPDTTHTPHTVDPRGNVATTWPALGNPKHTNHGTAVPTVSVADIAARDDVRIVTSDRVVVRSAAHVASGKVAACVRAEKDAALVGGGGVVGRVDRDDRVIVKDDRGCVNRVNSVRRDGGDKPGLGAAVVHAHAHAVPVEVQSYVVQHNVVHPVLVTQHIHHHAQHIAPQVISLIPITKLPPPNLIDHTTPPPPNYIPPQQQPHHMNHISTANPPHYHPPPQPYTQPPPQQIIIHPQNSVLYAPFHHLPANIPDVQMIEHQLQLQHNNNNNNTVHAKNTYNQQQSNSVCDVKTAVKANNNAQLNCTENDQSNAALYQQQASLASRRPAVVIMRDAVAGVGAPMGGDGRRRHAMDSVAGVEEDASCCELTFGFDVNEELLSLHDEACGGDVEQGGVDDEGDVGVMFARRFVVPDCCGGAQVEFNYEKIVDFVANAWHEVISDTMDGTCNFYQDL